MKLRLRIKTKQQPDGTWKAWTSDARLVVYAKTKVKAVDIVKMIFEDSGNPGHGERSVIAGLNSHSNIITSPDEPWHGSGGDA